MEELYLGVLSGTSMDAIDIALVNFSNNKKPKLMQANSFPLPKEYTKLCKLFAIEEKCSLQEFGELDKQAGILFADAINQFLTKHNINYKTISAIGSHGQTIKHYPSAKFPFSMQIGDPNTIAFKTKIPVITDFRRKDISAGGQGAPLAPILHQEIFQTQQENRFIINIGGISNISVLPKDKNLKIKGFDTGPGNCLMDLWCLKYFNKPYDNNGNIAQSGKLESDILDKLIQDKFFSDPNPKSTGIDYFNLSWLEKTLSNQTLKKCANNETLKINFLTTLCHFSAKTIAEEINKEDLSDARIFICGGGSHNKCLIELINKYAKFPVTTTNDLGLHPDWVEAVLFAVLAKKRQHSESLDLNAITGSKEPVILGGIYI